MNPARITAAVLIVAFAPLGAAPAQAATAPKRVPTYKNCTALNKIYPHGIGRKGARDKVAS